SGHPIEPGFKETLAKAFEITRADARLWMFAGYQTGWNPLGPTFPSFSAFSIACELDPEQGQYGVAEPRNPDVSHMFIVKRFQSYAHPERTELLENPESGPPEEDKALVLRADPEVRGAAAYAFGLGFSMQLDERDGLDFARRL